jgi:hypothetical protein
VEHLKKAENSTVENLFETTAAFVFTRPNCGFTAESEKAAIDYIHQQHITGNSSRERAQVLARLVVKAGTADDRQAEKDFQTPENDFLSRIPISIAEANVTDAAWKEKWMETWNK